MRVKGEKREKREEGGKEQRGRKEGVGNGTASLTMM